MRHTVFSLKKIIRLAGRPQNELRGLPAYAIRAKARIASNVATFDAAIFQIDPFLSFSAS